MEGKKRLSEGKDQPAAKSLRRSGRVRVSRSQPDPASLFLSGREKEEKLQEQVDCRQEGWANLPLRLQEELEEVRELYEKATAQGHEEAGYRLRFLPSVPSSNGKKRASEEDDQPGAKRQRTRGGEEEEEELELPCGSLWSAAYDGDLQTVKQWVEVHHANVNEGNEEDRGSTPLYAAAAVDRLTVVRYLVARRRPADRQGTARSPCGRHRLQ